MSLHLFPTGGRDGVQLDFLQSFTPQNHRKALELRDYQKTMKSEIYQLIKPSSGEPGVKRILVYSPTGSGKTLVLSSIAQDALSKSRAALIIVHRDFLIEQSLSTLCNLGVVREHIGVIKAGYPENTERPLQLASIQTLIRRRDALPCGIGLVIVDECHSVAFHKEYKRIKEANPKAIHLGFSASPWRLKPHTEYFGLHYQAIVRGPSIAWLIKRGYLSRVRYFAKGGVADISQLETNREGDFKERQMEKEFIRSQVPQVVVERLLERANGRTGIIFNAGREQSILQTRLLNDAGISCAHVDAHTPTDERRRIYQQLETGILRCISSIGCLTEGFDVKSISFIVLARATKSRALYVQMAGRGIRSALDKDDCLLLDFGGNIKRLGFLTSNWEITLEPKPKAEGEVGTKECPVCGCICHNFVRICPDCGYEFSGEKDVEPGAYEKEFGEIFDPQTRELVKYTRAQRKMRYTKNQPPDRLWEVFKEKYGRDTFLINDWLKGAIFAGKKTRANFQQLLDYLDALKRDNSEKSEQWVRFHLGLEFGALPSSIPRICCWQLLEVHNLSSEAEIKEAYRNALRKIDIEADEAEQIDLLNWALDKALRRSRP
ncbi:DEAD/DEAH box helicase [Leptolyngbya sp. FACHB-671]|uniref:DEAD/DEAH box helicase n=1 Tax=Leptolyngbya sp. FACHB-671 TaxID=2692812 RepID=UPI00168A2801|nr:DEAD/DEAH box helicase [Leptolyngbya sp. FACHB-671]MBD2066033.1 DEAD/DEAH box helicase [Leptolyngbya sp. FACHB-671]